MHWHWAWFPHNCPSSSLACLWLGQQPTACLLARHLCPWALQCDWNFLHFTSRDPPEAFNSLLHMPGTLSKLQQSEHGNQSCWQAISLTWHLGECAVSGGCLRVELGILHEQVLGIRRLYLIIERMSLGQWGAGGLLNVVAKVWDVQRAVAGIMSFCATVRSEILGSSPQ